ncbi:MAG: tyrosine-type recombinase/integrase [Chloroflexota bacterium]|nr:tyrosine-type recombinase/integrase [Chloroflexota bacterium]
MRETALARSEIAAHPLALTTVGALQKHPAPVYLARLAPSSRRVSGDDAHAAIGTRDAAILAVLYGAGLRRAEAVGLDLGDYDWRKGTLKVHGKGNKERVAYVGAGGRAAIEDWLELRGATAGPLFWPVHRSGHIGPGRRLTAQAVLYLARRRADDAHIDAFSPHDFRRSFVSDLLDAGVDLSSVQQLAGHAQVQTTARYDRRGDEAKAEAAKQLHVPYRRRRRSSLMA